MKTIMIVEDDEFFRSALKDFLSKKFQVIEAENGIHAQNLLTATSPDLILSDIKMPQCSGIQLLEWVKVHKPQIPVILMTGFSEVLETKKAHDLGASDFIPKPFKSAELHQKIDAILYPSEKKWEFDGGTDRDFCSLPVEDFLTDKDTEFGIFVRAAENKYIKISHKGGKIPEAKLKVFKENGVHFLYVKQADFARIVGFTVNVAKVINASEKVEDGKKLRFAQYTGSLIVQQAFQQGTDKVLFSNAKDFLTSSVSVITENDDAFNVLDQLNEHSDFLYSHSLGVSLYSVMIAKRMGINSPQTLFKLAMAGLFHNIGFKEIPTDIIKKGRFKLTKEERMLIESHPIRGKEILESIKGIPTDVIQIAYEHHEDLIGTGYPRRIDRKKIHPLTRIISAADNFCCLTLKNPENEFPLEGPAAIEKLKETKGHLLDPQCLKIISDLFEGKIAV